MRKLVALLLFPVALFGAAEPIMLDTKNHTFISPLIVDFAGVTVLNLPGSGTVTTFSAGNLSPIFVTNVTNPTTTPALSFTLSNFGGHAFLGNNTGSAAPPTAVQPTFSDLSGSFALTQSPSTTASKLIGRGDSGAGSFQEITLGTNLSITGTTLNATGGGGGNVSNSGTPTVDQTAVWTDATHIKGVTTLKGGSGSQVLTKSSATDYDWGWVTPSSGGNVSTSGTITSGQLAEWTDATHIRSDTTAQAKTAIGASTVGGNLISLTNPSAITFLKINADNSVTAENAATFRSDIGAGTGDVVGPASSTDFAYPMFNGTTGKLLQNSNMTGDSAGTVYANHSASIAGALSSTIEMHSVYGGGAATNNFGTTLDYYLESSTTDNRQAARLGVAWLDATDASRSAYMDFLLVNNATTWTSKMRLFPDGSLSVNNTTDPGAGYINVTSGYKINNVALSKSDVGLSNVTNDAQTQAAIVPNTAPSAGQILVGNGTAYAKQTVSGSGATMSLGSTGVLTISAIANASLANSAITIGNAGSTSLGGTASTDSIIGMSGTGLVKRTGTNAYTAATAKTDYWDTTDFVASGASHAHGLVPDPGATGGSSKFLREDATWVVPAGGGNVSNSGTPTVDQTAVWTDSTHIKGVTTLKGGTLTTQFLKKNSATDYDYSWVRPQISDLTDVSSVKTLIGSNATGTNIVQIALGSGLDMTGSTLNVTSGGGNVSNSGTPTSGQTAVWTDATHIQGVTSLAGGTSTQVLKKNSGTDYDYSWGAAGTGTVTTTGTPNTGMLSAFSGTTSISNVHNTLGVTGYLKVDAADAFALETADAHLGSLGAVTVGKSFFTLTNPNAITFPRINADNSVSALDASTFRTAIGATSIGSNFFTLSSLAAITFARINADNTITLQNANDFKISLGATSVGINILGLTNPNAVRFLRINADNSVTARTAGELAGDLSLVVGTNVEAWDTQLDSLAGLSYTGNGLKVVRVNSGETGFELATVSGGGAPGGLDTQVQYRVNSTTFGGITNATSDGTTMTLTSPKLVTSILDTNGNKFFDLTATGSAVNYLTLANAATTTNPALSLTGSDSDIGLTLNLKGSASARFTVSGGDGMTIQANQAQTGGVSEIFYLGVNSTGTPTNGFGGALIYKAEDSTTNDTELGGIAMNWTDVAHATRKSVMKLANVNNGVYHYRLVISPTGGINVGDDADGMADPGLGYVNAETGFKISGTSIFPVTTANGGVPAGGSTGQVLKKNSATDYDTVWGTVSGTGDVVGPASATDNAIARFDTTTGKLIQNSPITISDDTSGGDGSKINANGTATNVDLTLAPKGTGWVFIGANAAGSLPAQSNFGPAIGWNYASGTGEVDFINTYNTGAGFSFLNFQGTQFAGLNASGLSLPTSESLLWSTDLGISRNAAGIAEVNNGTAGQYRDILTRGLRSNAVTFANAIAAPVDGTLQAFTDSSTNTQGATITGGGSNHVVGYYNGTNWIVTSGSGGGGGNVSNSGTPTADQLPIWTDDTHIKGVTVSGSGATISLANTGVITISAIANASLSNSSMTIAGTSTSLGGSITQDTITGLSTTGLVKRTAANTLSTVTAPSGDVVGTSDTQTLTSKRINPRTNATTSNTNWTPNSDSYDEEIQTALAGDATINAPSGTPVQGQKLILRITSNASPHNLSFNGTYTAIGVTIPTSIAASKTIYVGCIYNATLTRWDVVAVATEA